MIRSPMVMSREGSTGIAVPRLEDSDVNPLITRLGDGAEAEAAS